MNRLDQVLPSRGNSTNQIGKNGEAFGARLQNQVNADPDRPLVDWRTKGAVEQREQLVLSSQRSCLFQVYDAQRGIGRGFEGQDLRVRTNGSGMLVILSRFLKGCFNPKPGQPAGEELRHSSINVSLRDDVVAALYQ